MPNRDSIVDRIFDLGGKVVLITGGSRGLGRAIAMACAQQGATTVIASRKLANCQRLAADISAATGAPSVGMHLHVGQWESCNQLLAELYERFAGIDVLINNAGMSPLYPSVGAVTEELFDKTLAVNLKGPFRLMATIGERMQAQPAGGSIVNISSISAIAPGMAEIPYAAAKAGLNAMTRGLARGWGPKVRVNGVMPGAFLTDISKAWDMPAFARRAETQIPLKRGGEPDEIVGAVLFLISPAGSYTTGTTVKVDGGAAWGAD